MTAPFLNTPKALAHWKSEHPGQCWLPLTEHQTTLTIALPEGTTLADPIPELNLSHGEIKATFTGELKENQLVLHAHYLQPAGFLEKPNYEALRVLTQKYLQALTPPILLNLLPKPTT